MDPWSIVPECVHAEVCGYLSHQDWNICTRISTRWHRVSLLWNARPFELQMPPSYLDCKTVLTAFRPRSLVIGGYGGEFASRIFDAMPVLESRLTSLAVRTGFDASTPLHFLFSLVKVTSLTLRLNSTLHVDTLVLPPALEHLELGGCPHIYPALQIPISAAPATLTKLVLKNSFPDEKKNEEVMQTRLTALQHLEMSHHSELVWRGSFPHLKKLFVSEIDDVFSSTQFPTLTHLCLFPHITTTTPSLLCAALDQLPLLSELDLGLIDDAHADGKTRIGKKKEGEEEEEKKTNKNKRSIERLTFRCAIGSDTVNRIAQYTVIKMQLLSVHAFPTFPYHVFSKHTIVLLETSTLPFHDCPFVIGTIGTLVLRQPPQPLQKGEDDMLQQQQQQQTCLIDTLCFSWPYTELIVPSYSRYSKSKTSRNEMDQSFVSIAKRYPSVKRLVFGDWILGPKSVLASQLGDILIRFTRLVSIDLSRLCIRGCTTLSPLDFVTQHLYGEQHSLVTHLPQS